jgi:hypothetical protein
VNLEGCADDDEKIAFGEVLWKSQLCVRPDIVDLLSALAGRTDQASPLRKRQYPAKEPSADSSTSLENLP